MDTPKQPVALPDELLEFIADGVDSREDLLALALTCSSFCRVIIPDRLYRSLTLCVTNASDYLNRLSQKPRLVQNVYSVAVVNGTVVSPVKLRYGEGMIPSIEWTKTMMNPFIGGLRDALALCPNLSCMRLNSGIQDSWRMTEESINSLLDPHINILRDVCLDITRFHTSPTFSVSVPR